MRTFSAMSVAIDAKANPMPMPSNPWFTQICHGWEWNAGDEACPAAATNEHPRREGPLEADPRPDPPGDRAREEQHEGAGEQIHAPRG